MHKLVVALSLLTTSFGASSAAPSDTYLVYGTQIFSTSIPEWWQQGYHPDQFGSTLLGSASTTASFTGSFNYYIVTTVIPNIVLVDSIVGSNFVGYSANATGNTLNWQGISGLPDGNSASVGGLFNGAFGGFAVVNATGSQLTSVTVFATSVPEVPTASALLGGLLALAALRLGRQTKGAAPITTEA